MPQSKPKFKNIKAIVLVTTPILIFSINTADAAGFFGILRTLGSVTSKIVDVSSKAASTANSIDAMRHRRTNNEFQANKLNFNNGFLSNDEGFLTTENDLKYADSLRISAWKHVENKAFHTAKSIYEKSLSIDANNSNTWHGYGDVLSKLEMYDASNNSFATAIYLNNYHNDAKQESETWRYLGWNHQKQGYLKISKKYYVESLAINPENSSSKHALKHIRAIAIPNIVGSKVYTVTAESGLRLRSQPSIRSRVIDDLPFEADLNLLRYAGKTTAIHNKSGRWAQVSYQGKVGYVFDAYIKKVGAVTSTSNPTHKVSTQKTPNTIQKTTGNRHFHGSRSHTHRSPKSSHNHNNGITSTYEEGNSKSIMTQPSRSAAVTVIQAGVFANISGARALMSSLDKGTYKPKINKRQNSGKQLFYVEYSGLGSKSKAESIKIILKETHPQQNFFIKEYVNDRH